MERKRFISRAQKCVRAAGMERISFTRPEVAKLYCIVMLGGIVLMQGLSFRDAKYLTNEMVAAGQVVKYVEEA